MFLQVLDIPDLLQIAAFLSLYCHYNSWFCDHLSLYFFPQHYHNTIHSPNNDSKLCCGLNGVFIHLRHKVLCVNVHNEQKGTTGGALCPRGNGERFFGVTEEQGVLLQVRTPWASFTSGAQAPAERFPLPTLNATIPVINRSPRSDNHPGLNIKISLRRALSWHQLRSAKIRSYWWCQGRSFSKF